MTDQAEQKWVWRVLRVVLPMLVCLLLLGAAAGALYVIYRSEPTAQIEGATRKTAALVDTTIVKRGTYRPELVVLGNVQPAREIMLASRVAGEVLDLDTRFVPGGEVQAGQPLVMIDPADYKNTLTLRRSELKQAQAELKIEEGRQAVARMELETLGKEVSKENRALVLREPQIASIRAQVKAARAAVAQAKLDVERAQVKAPFDALIMSRMANLGSQVGVGDPVARLVGTNEYWVIASLPMRNLEWVVFTSDEKSGSSVDIRLKNIWKPGEKRVGKVTRLIGELDAQTRLAQVLITVADPLARESEGPRLLMDTIVEARITGEPIEGVVRLNADYLRQNDTVWVMKDGNLDIREVQVVFRDAVHAYIGDGLENGDEVVITGLASVKEGRPLRRNEIKQASDDGTPKPEADE